MIDPDGAVLLLRGCDPSRPEAGSWWLTPGGGVDDGETLTDAARRELVEETGLVVTDVGVPFFDHAITFDFEGQRFHQSEHFFSVRTERFAAHDRGWTDIERRSVLEQRWWLPAEISASEETFYPENLVSILDQLAGPL